MYYIGATAIRTIAASVICYAVIVFMLAIPAIFDHNLRIYLINTAGSGLRSLSVLTFIAAVVFIGSRIIMLLFLDKAGFADEVSSISFKEWRNYSFAEKIIKKHLKRAR